ncbi:MAG: hypothetical protein IJT15_02300 [Rickettsiales bacterium]|nr:hypothetical protein [Rickettsiales bacterium]
MKINNDINTKITDLTSQEDKNKNNIISLDEEVEEKKILEKENVHDEQSLDKQNNAKGRNQLKMIRQKINKASWLKLNLNTKSDGVKIETDTIINMKRNAGVNKNLFSFDQKDINENRVGELTNDLYNFDIKDGVKKNNTTFKDDVFDFFQYKNEDKTKNVLSGQKRRRNDKNEVYDEEGLQDSLNNEAKKQTEISKNDQQCV